MNTNYYLIESSTLKTILILFFLTPLIIFSQTTSGPEWIKNELIANNVFNGPNYSFTTDYDSELGDNESHIKGLFFDSIDYNGSPTTAFCWYGVPENLDVAAGETAPAVVLAHGGGGTAFPAWIKKWNDRGYIAIAVALEGQVPGDKIDGSYQTIETSGPKRTGFFNDVDQELQNQWFYHAVSNLTLAHSLLTSFDEVDASNIGINGISWGGILTNVVTGIDDRIAFSIPVYGCGFLDETPLYSKILSNTPDAKELFYLENWEPSLYIPLQTMPTLFVNGNKDLHFSMNSFMKTYENSPNEKYLSIPHEMPHGHGSGWAPNDIYNFADYITANGVQPLTYTDISINDSNEVTYTYEYEGVITEAFLYHTTDVGDWSKAEYTWIETPITVKEDNKTIIAEIPTDALYYYVNSQTASGAIYSAPMNGFTGKLLSTNEWYHNHSSSDYLENYTNISGTYTKTIANPNTIAINDETMVSQFQKAEGLYSQIVYKLPGAINDLSNTIIKLQAYLDIPDEDIAGVTNNNIWVMLRKSGVHTGPVARQIITSGRDWKEFTFDFTNVNSTETYYDELLILFASNDNDNDAIGFTYYFDALQGPELNTSILNVVEQELNSKPILYPNPAKEILYTNLSADIVSAKIYNTTGQLLEEYNLITNKGLDISGYQSGVFFIRLQSKNGKVTTFNYIKE